MNTRDESILFYYEIGLAITQWASVEAALRDVIVQCVSAGTDRRWLSIGFYSIENFRSKVSFCDNLLIETFERCPVFSKWQPLRARLEKAASKRNRIAHRTPIVYMGASPGKQHALVDWQVGHFTAKSRQPKFTSNTNPPEGSLGLIDIVHMRYAFFSLFVELSNFAAEISNKPLPYDPKKFAPPQAPSLFEYNKQMVPLINQAVTQS